MRKLKGIITANKMYKMVHSTCKTTPQMQYPIGESNRNMTEIAE